MLVPFAFSAVQPGDASQNGGLGLRNAPNTAFLPLPPHAPGLAAFLITALLYSYRLRAQS